MATRKSPGTVRRALIRVGEAKLNQLTASSNLNSAEAAIEDTRRTIFRDKTEQAYFMGLAEMDYAQARFAYSITVDALGKARADCERAMEKILRRPAKKKGRA